MVSATFNAIAKDGKLVFADPGRVTAWLALAKDEQLHVTLERASRRRTLPQNARYWKAIVPFAAEVFEQKYGIPFTPEAAHFALKIAFNGHVAVNIGGEDILIPKTTTELDTKEFASYCNRIELWIEQEFHVNPDLIQAEDEIP